MGRVRQEMRKRGVWLRHADAERVLSVMKKRALLFPNLMNEDDYDVIKRFEKRVKEMRDG